MKYSFTIDTTFFFEDYEALQTSSQEFGERVQSQRVPCGRQMLRVDGDVAKPFYGGKTHFQNGSEVTPPHFDARVFPQVNIFFNIISF